MDIPSKFKDEVFRPIVTNIVPGAIAFGPWIAVIGYSIPGMWKFWDTHSTEAYVIVGVLVIAAGMLMEDLGALLEAKILDGRLKRKMKAFDEEWEQYLASDPDEQMVATRYLRSIVVRLKFELSMIPALLICAFGLFWVNRLYHVWGDAVFVIIAFAFLIGTLYLLYEAAQSTRNAYRVRTCICKAVSQGKVMQPAASNIATTTHTSTQCSIEGVG